jgi:hypothetical protein
VHILIYECVLCTPAHDADYATALDACKNVKETLAAMGTSHRYTGVSAGVLKSVVGEKTKVLPISRLLEV